MERSTNALAELAERLDLLVVKTLCTIPGEHSVDIRKAQRIVAELAKVAYAEGLSYNAANAVAISRAIAEEGAGDGK